MNISTIAARNAFPQGNELAPMLERLYCPDFSAIFHENFANPFIYPLIDSLQWPLLVDIEFPTETRNLLSLKDERGHPLFYRRKISSMQWELECRCASIGHVLFQAFYLDKEHNISNSQVIAACQKVNPRASAIVCPNFTEFDIDFMKNNAKYISGVVFYPLFQKLDINKVRFNKVLQHCNETGIPVKWDFHEYSIPKTRHIHEDFYNIVSLLDQYPNVVFIISGLDPSGINEVTEKMKYYPRLWVELDHRIIGGMTPVTFYKKMFSTPGLIQNCWDRIILGSATPTLEASQLSRGIWEATTELPFNLKSLLRTWLMRNAYRIFKLPLARIATGKSCKGNGGGSLVETQRVEAANGTKKRVIISHELNLQSFSITQLLWLQPWILESWKQVKNNYQDITVGNLLLRSYHTTTSILMNEHERGNYLQLHYDLAASTREDASTKLHTVAAEENRADFNYPDHSTASSVGNRQVLIPIKDDSLDMGGRENYYILVTFGPRAVKLLLKYDLILDT